jgi:peptide/nickel transport system substrate-binding protein
MIPHNMDVLRRIRRREFMEMCAGSLALAAAGCNRRDHRARRKDSNVTVYFWGDEHDLSDYWSSMQYLVFLPLVRAKAQGGYEPRLAESWEHSGDFSHWTIHLRKNVRWHDGVPTTAHDIKFTLEVLSHPKVSLLAPDSFHITVLDDYTYTINYRENSMGDATDRWTVYWPKHLLEKLDPGQFRNWDFWMHPVGNGPYRWMRTVPKTMSEFEANPDYYRGKPKIDRVVLKFGPNSNSAALTELLSGDVDAVSCCQLSAIDLLKLKGDPRFRPYYYLQPYKFTMIAWNHHNSLFGDTNVRRALTLAINRRELQKALNLPDDLPVVDAFVTENQYLRGEFPSALPYDPEQAKLLLDQAGWSEIAAHGVRKRAGQEFRFTALVSPTEQELDRAAVYIQAQLRQLGIQMEINTLEELAKSQRVKAGQFEAVFSISMFESEYGSMASLFAEGSPMGYNNPKVAALRRAARATMNPDETDRIYRELASYFQTDMPVTFLYPCVWPSVGARWIRGLSSPVRTDACMFMEDLSLEGD